MYISHQQQVMNTKKTHKSKEISSFPNQQWIQNFIQLDISKMSAISKRVVNGNPTLWQQGRDTVKSLFDEEMEKIGLPFGLCEDQLTN